MFTNINEEKFFLKHLSKNHKVLEYGSGQSTIQIADLTKEVVSVEHQEAWFNKINENRPSNCRIILAKPDLPYVEGGHCGLYNEFKTYVETPKNFAPFDIILIDGRARVACASICNILGHKDTLVFIHDFDRPEYKEALKYLQLLDSCDTMIVCKIRF